MTNRASVDAADEYIAELQREIRELEETAQHEFEAVTLTTNERDFWIMKYMRLEAAINHHRKSDNFKDVHDDALYKMADKLAETHFE